MWLDALPVQQDWLSCYEPMILRSTRSIPGSWPVRSHPWRFQWCVEAGSQLYRVGTETPRLLATSRAATPLESSFFAALILPSVICRLRPPLRPSWRAISKPSPGTLHDQFPLHLSQTGHDVKEEAAGGRASVDGIGQTLELHFLLLKLPDEIDQVLDAAAEPIQLPNDKGVSCAKTLTGWARPGRSARLPLIRSSKIFFQPALWRASVCSSRCWS